MALPDSLKVVPGTPIIWGEAGGAGVTHTLSLGASWLYDWTANPPHSDVPVEAVPMLGRDWGDGPVPQVGGNSPYILGFNEPDLSSQANLTPQRAAVLWRRIVTSAVVFAPLTLVEVDDDEE